MHFPRSKLLDLEFIELCLATVSVDAERGDELWSFECLFKSVRIEMKSRRLLAKVSCGAAIGLLSARTVASQQIRTSYRAPGVRPSSRIHVSTPLGASPVGNDALILVLAVVKSGDIGIRHRSSRFGCSVGIVIAGGPRKMVFSTFADTSEKMGAQTSREGM